MSNMGASFYFFPLPACSFLEGTSVRLTTQERLADHPDRIVTTVPALLVIHETTVRIPHRNSRLCTETGPACLGHI